MPNETVNMTMSDLIVHPKTKALWYKYLEQKRGKAALLQQLIIHAEKTGFNAATASLEWESSK